MTVIAAIYTPGHGVIASDSNHTYWHAFHFVSTEPKLVRGPNTIWGCCGQARPRDKLDLSIMDSAPIQEVADHVVEVFEKYGLEESNHSFLILRKQGLYHIGDDGGWNQVPEGQLWAVGSGREYAFGADYTIRNHPIALRVTSAVQAACFYDPSCGGDCQLMEMKSESHDGAPVRRRIRAGSRRKALRTNPDSPSRR